MQAQAIPWRRPRDPYVDEVLPMISPRIRAILENLPQDLADTLEEIRLRAGKPVILHGRDYEITLTDKGLPSGDLVAGWTVPEEEIARTLQIMSGSSIYALEEELKNGYLTIPGGHRVGLAGKAVVANGRVETLKYITGLNIRLSREVKGAADEVMAFVLHPVAKTPLHVLIVSPPQCGKTTLLRDMVRQLSEGVPRLHFPGVKVGVVDERSELAGCYQGLPTNDLGIRTDVLDGCPKAEGIMMLVRSMSPVCIAVDEIGRREDVAAVEEALGAGVKLIATAHGSSIEDISNRPILKELLALRFFERVIVLGRSRGVGTVEHIWNETLEQDLLRLLGRRKHG